VLHADSMLAVLLVVHFIAILEVDILTPSPSEGATLGVRSFLG